MCAAIAKALKQESNETYIIETMKPTPGGRKQEKLLKILCKTYLACASCWSFQNLHMNLKGNHLSRKKN